MWSTSLTAEHRRELVAALRSALPPPRPGARPYTAFWDASATPVEVAAALQDRPDFLWLDHHGSAPRLLLDPLVRLSVTAGVATIEGPLATISLPVSGLDLLEAALEAWAGPPEALLAGYLGYELGAELEDLRMPAREPADLPDLVLYLYDSALVFTGKWQLTGTDAWRIPVPPEIPSVPPSSPLPGGSLYTSPSAAEFRVAVQDVVRRIHAGEVFQVNICRRLETPLPAPLIWSAYLALRKETPAAYGAFLRIDAGTALLSASPELFLRIEGRQVSSQPIKGTRRRAVDAAEDQALAGELLESDKDAAELAMIVDVTRNDLGRVCSPGSIAVAFHRRLMSLPTVHHTVSEVTGSLSPGEGPANLLRACFPPASISGAPKIRAIEIAALEEGRRRGACMGSIGWISLDGRLELSVAIRTAVASRGSIWYLAGCGITSGSDPASELAESQTKASAFLRALQLPEILDDSESP